MHCVDNALKVASQPSRWVDTIRRAAAAPRTLVYLACTIVALLTSYHLGKDMGWDTLDYHFYAGFAALHGRFSRDYFAAGSESYLNPYAYVPFYLLASSGLSSLAVASVLAAVQSAILWLTYELALEVAPEGNRRARLVMAVCAAAFAFANPILINQFGTSYADITTAELVLAGWLLLVRAVRSPSTVRIACAGLLLGSASALKMTNAVTALGAVTLLIFLPTNWCARFRHAVTLGSAMAVSFVLVCGAWSLRLEQHFGNPLFPLLNNLFRSPQYPSAAMIDYRFIPDSLREALWRPFAIIAPRFAVDDELQAPDLRYALVVLGALAVLILWIWRRFTRSPAPRPSGHPAGSSRSLAALGCALAADWVLWLRTSGNGRYFLPMACVAAVVGIALVFRLLALEPRVRNGVLAAVLAAQFVQLRLGANYRAYVPWDGKSWFEVSVPAALASQPNLYLSYGVQSNSFLFPFLAPGSGFVNVGGDYPLVRQGVNGAEVQSLIRRYAPHLELIAPETRTPGVRYPIISLSDPDDALALFGLRAAAGSCETLVASDQGPQPPGTRITSGAGAAPKAASEPLHDVAVAKPDTAYFSSCRVVANPAYRPPPAGGERTANLVFDTLEDACPEVFQPRRPVTVYYGNAHGGPIWARRYLSTNITAWINSGWVLFIDPVRGGPAMYIGKVSAFEHGTPNIDCGRRHERYYAKVLPGSP